MPKSGFMTLQVDPDMPSFDDISILCHEGRHLLFGRSSGCLVVTNAAGHCLAQCLANRLSPEDILKKLAGNCELPIDLAGRLAQEFLADWTAAGLFGGPPPIPETMPDVTGGAFQSLAVSRGAIAVDFRTNCPNLQAQVRSLMAPLVSDVVTGIIPTRVEAVRQGETYVVGENGRPVWMPANLDEARFLTARSIAAALCGRDRLGFVMHAGAVAGDDGCLVITATSGSGKSTLIASLVATGLSYLSDDQVPIHISGLAAFPFPTALGLKPGSLSLPNLRPLIDRAAPDDRSRPGVTFLHMPALHRDHAAVPVRAVVLPAFDAEGPNRVEPLSFAEALRCVLLAGTEMTRDVNMVDALSTLLTRRPVVRLRFNRTDYGVAMCKELLQCKNT